MALVLPCSKKYKLFQRLNFQRFSFASNVLKEIKQLPSGENERAAWGPTCCDSPVAWVIKNSPWRSKTPRSGANGHPSSASTSILTGGQKAAQPDLKNSLSHYILYRPGAGAVV